MTFDRCTFLRIIEHGWFPRMHFHQKPNTPIPTFSNYYHYVFSNRFQVHLFPRTRTIRLQYFELLFWKAKIPLYPYSSHYTPFLYTSWLLTGRWSILFFFHVGCLRTIMPVVFGGWCVYTLFVSFCVQSHDNNVEMFLKNTYSFTVPIRLNVRWFD